MDKKVVGMGCVIVALTAAVMVQGTMIASRMEAGPTEEVQKGFVLSGSVSANGKISDPENAQRIQGNLSYIQSIIDEYYLYDSNETDQETGIYKGFLGGLGDPYSAYYTPAEYENMMQKSKGEYSGIGAVLTQDPDTMLISVVRVYEDSPAEAGGLMPGDIIMKVDGEDISQMELSDAVMLIKGEEHTKVMLEVYRKDSYDRKTAEITRENIELPTLTYRMMEDKIGYIYIASWEEVTTAQYIRAMEDLEQQGMEALVVDLRDNPGGVFTTVCQILDYMVEDGETLVYTLTKKGEKTEMKGGDGHAFRKPLAVIVNGNSASASEIFAGGIQDFEAGTIVGTTTYGKGIVQRFITLGNHAAMKLTVSEYYLPSGVCIHKKGITPDVEVELSEELRSKVSIAPEEDNQLAKAIEVLKEELRRNQSAL